MPTVSTDFHPYRITLQNVVHGLYYYNNDECLLTNVKKLNERHGPENPRHLSLQQLKFSYSGTGSFASLGAALGKLPSEQPIENKLITALLLSYFGNAAKKKLKELSTPTAILKWVMEEPLDVLRTMNVWLPEARTEEQMKKLFEAQAPLPAAMPWVDYATTSYTVRIG